MFCVKVRPNILVGQATLGKGENVISPFILMFAVRERNLLIYIIANSPEVLFKLSPDGE